MPLGTRPLLLAFFCVISSQIFAQSVVVTTQNPDALYVCGQDAFDVTIKNNTTAPLTDLKVTVSLPTGIEYVPGSISGATESSLANPGAPVFALADLPMGATVVLSGQEKATCSVIAAINIGQVFSNIVSVASSGGSQQITSLNYLVETGLLFIVSVTPAAQDGQSGQVLTRTITIRNTRQGPISSLQFSDQHFPGLSMQLVGISGTNSGGVLYKADVPGSYFTAFGDGDNLLEVNETVTFTEQVSVEHCGIPSFTNPSTITIGWGCDGETCQSDVTTPQITILPSALNPVLQFIPIYTPPANQCASEPATQELLIINTGGAIAQNILVSLQANDTLLRQGLDYNSVAYQSGGAWLPIAPNAGTQQALSGCNATGFYNDLLVAIPSIPAGDTLRLHFDTYFCQAACLQKEVGAAGSYSYESACPDAPPQSGYFLFRPDTLATALQSSIYFDFGNCIADSSVYTFTYWVKSQRLLHGTGFVRLDMELPWGLFLQDNCITTLDGKAPVLRQIDSIPGTSTTLHLAFQLPMSLDSVFGEFCLLNICQHPSNCAPTLPSTPMSGASYTVYSVEPSCSACIQRVSALTSITTSLDISANCGTTYCDQYELVLNCPDGSGGGGGGGGGGSGDGNGGGVGGALETTYDAWRLNIGLRDDNDDRMADNGSPANPALIRRDRFLPGDTLHTQLRGVVTSGEVTGLLFRLFHECRQSDFGVDGGDMFNLLVGQDIFTNSNELRYLRSSIILKVGSTGATYTCPIDSAQLRIDRNYIEIDAPNIRPQQPYDRLITMFHQFGMSWADLADGGCMPANLVLLPGDSLLFQADFVFRQNFTPLSVNDPPLINFRSAVCEPQLPFAWKWSDCFPPLLRQYSGYIERNRPPVYGILPCSTSTELFPFRYNIRIARGNLFPYEIRPLAWLSDFDHTSPGVELLETRLKLLRLQESTMLVSDQILPTTQVNNMIHLNLNPFFTPPLDEGFALEIGSVFAPSCDFVDTLHTVTRVKVRYPNEVFHKPVGTIELETLNGYNSAAPKLVLIAEDSFIEVSTDQFEVDFFLRNLMPAASPNSWLSISTTGSGLSDVEIVLLPSGQTVPSVAGIFQLGSIMGLSQPRFRLRGTLIACEPIVVTFAYGWDCDPVTNLSGQPCGSSVRTIRLVPQLSELELVIVGQPDAVKMCTPSEYFIFEIYNAAEGRAYTPVGSIKLPPGLTVLAGSSQLAYPTGGTWVALPDPVALPGNVYEWSPTLPNGLLPFAESPQNSLRIRFRVIAECGFVANSQPIYGADCRQLCGLAGNRLRKPHSPIQLEGLEPAYTVNAQLALADPNGSADCGEATQLSAVLVVGGAPTSGDSIYLILPAGVHYVAGSYQPGPNAPAGPPQATSQGVQLPLPGGVAGSEVRFTFSVRYDDAAGCSDQAVVLQTRQKGQAFCALTNQNCSVYVATGEAILFLKTNNAELLLKDFAATAADNGVTYSAVLENVGTGAAKNPLVQFFLDQNHNGQMDANEPVVGSSQTTGTLSPNALLVIGGALQLTTAQLCDLAALLPATANCSCTDRVIPLGGQAIIRQAIGLCGLAAVPLQVDSVAGSIYTWLTPEGLGCTTCTQTVYTPAANVQSGDLVTLVLVERTATCTIQHQFDLQFGGMLGVETTDQTVCEGESVELHATPGGTYIWSGPGITNPTLATQVLQPTQDANYTVTVTFAGGCTGIGQVAVTLLARDSMDLGVRTTCVGAPIEIFGQMTETPGIYTQVFPQANGCNGIIYVRLELVPNETSEVRPLCIGDSIMVFDSLFHQPGSLCKTFSSAIGCDSTHCVTVTSVPNPIIPAQDSVIIQMGQSITLDGPDGFTEYVWLPSTSLSCNTCSDPVAMPDSTTNYLLVVADEHGCVGSVQYRVLVFPPCDPKRLLIPNAFTPNGDQINDKFTVVPFEGLESILELTIYDRWGEKVYTGSGPTAAWDGTIAGKPAPSDVYVWRLVVDCAGEKTPITMEVTLLR